MIERLRDKLVIVTGGTMGIGLETGLAFARCGARVVLTHKWGTADEASVRRRFREAGGPPPRIVEADAGSPEDTQAMLESLRADFDRVEVFVPNVSMALVVRGIEDYDRRALHKSIDYSAWPLVDGTRRIKAVFGRYPRYVVGLSSGGPDHYYQNYDFVAASKAVMETLIRYMTYRLYDEDIRINVVRSRLVRTESLRATFGRDFEAFAERFNMKRQFVPPEEVANVILALSSGLMDGIRGQVIMVDRGTTFFDNLMRLYQERDSLDAFRETTGGQDGT